MQQRIRKHVQIFQATKEANNSFCLFFTVDYFFCPLDMLSPYDPSGCNQSNHGKHAVVKVIHK
jgi:hypothetical protein